MRRSRTPQGDRHLHTKSELEGKLRLLLGGYASEREVLGEVSSGSENDLKRASEIAHKMVAQLGMSEQLGPIYHEHRSDHPFLGARIATDGGISDATVHQIETEANRLVSDALRDATETIRGQRPLLDIMVQALLKNETLEKDELAELLPPAPKASGTRLERHDNVVELAPGKSDNDAASAP